MAVKYTIPYRSIDDTPWRVDISTAAYSGDPIPVRGFADNACVIEYDGGVDDPFDNPVVSSKVSMQLINQGELDMDELQNAGDRDFVVEVYRDNVLKWKGYLVTDNIQQPLLSTPYVVQLSAIDGLNMLESITYTHNNLITNSIGIANRAPLNFLRQCLFASSNLGLMLPIRWHVGLQALTTEDDAIAGMMTWSPYGDGFVAGQSSDGTIYQNCRYIVEGLVKAFGCRIFQADGAWHVMRTTDIIGGSFTYNECDATLGLPTITQHTVDITRTISGRGQGGDYEFIREDALLTVKPALGLVDVGYDSDRRENILPNGGLDLWSLGVPLYWDFEYRAGAAPMFNDYESLRQDGFGQSVEVSNGLFLLPATDYDVFRLSGGLPVDANILFKRFTWGFTILPLEGFPLTDYDPNNPDGQVIDWETSPIQVRVSYNAKDRNGDIQTMFLNEYGYWQYTPPGGYMALISYNKQQSGGNTTFTYRIVGSPLLGNTISFRYTGGSGTEYTVGAGTAGDLYGTLNDMLNNAWQMPVVISRTVTAISAYEVEVVIVDDGLTSNDLVCKIVSGKDTILDGNWLPIQVDTLKMGDIAHIAFQGKGGNNEIIFPDPGVLDGTQLDTTGLLNIEFKVMPGQRYVLDEIWVRTEDNNDVYRVNSPVTGNNTSQRITMGISSSFSGFMVSNLMRSYSQSNEDFIWSDGDVEASLTEHYARAVMRWRYKPSRIFNGTINTRTKDWSFFEVYSLIGGNFLPLKAQYNTERCEVGLVAMEGRDDGVITDVKHYASNNMPLSNYGG